MNPIPGKCPVCSNAMHVTRLQCGNCGTGIDGVFALGRLQGLTPEQVQFVEAFLKCKGKIKDVEGELGISYPTVVGRLNEVVRAMGFDAGDTDVSQMSDVDQYEFYEAQVIDPQGPMPPMRPQRPAPPMPPMPPMAPFGPQAPHIPGPRIHGAPPPPPSRLS